MSVDVEAYYTQYGPMVLRRCRLLLKDEELAVDAMHDVFVKLIQHENRLVGGAPSSLLYRMATNHCLNLIRSKKRKPEHPDEALLWSLAEIDNIEARSGAKRLVARIFKREKESTGVIAVLHLVDGMTLEEVSNEVGLSVSGVRKRLRTLKGRVKDLELDI